MTGRRSAAIRRTDATVTSISRRMLLSCRKISGSALASSACSTDDRSIFSAVNCWPRSSCNSRAMRVFSSSRTFCRLADSSRNSSRDLRCALSALTRSVMSRSMTVYSLLPPSNTWEIDASIGNSSPVLRSPNSTRCCLPIWRSDTPVTPNWSTCRSCAARKRSGMKRDSEAPSASAARQPNTCSAIGLKMTIFCRSSTVMIASIDERMIAIMRASLTLDWLRASLVAMERPRARAI